MDGVCGLRAEVDAIRKLFRHITAARIIGLVGGKEVFEDITSCLENIQYCTFDAEDVLDGWYLLQGLNFGSEGGRPGHYPFSLLLWFIETESITLETIGKTYGETSILYTDLKPLLFKAGVTGYIKTNHFIYEDDETFWSAIESGTGSYTVAVAEETTTKIKGSSSLKLTVSAGAFKDMGCTHAWGTAKDWSHLETLCFYLYGANTGLNVTINLEATDWANRFYWQITDDFTGWKRFELAFADVTESGSPDQSTIQAIKIFYVNVNQAFTSYLALTELEVEEEADKANLAVDYELGTITVTLDPEAVEWCWSYNGNTSVYTGEHIDINDTGANDVVLPPIQTTSIGDAIYFGAMSVLDGISLTVGTAGIYADITLKWQYWDGDSWEDFDDVVDETSFSVAGATKRIRWTKPSDIETSVVNGEEAYWIRCVVTAFGGSPSITTAPLGTQGWLFLEKTTTANYEHIIE
jgi:hypothetical protein